MDMLLVFSVTGMAATSAYLLILKSQTFGELNTPFARMLCCVIAALVALLFSYAAILIHPLQGRLFCLGLLLGETYVFARLGKKEKGVL